jgi:CBS domain-containing protein
MDDTVERARNVLRDAGVRSLFVVDRDDYKLRGWVNQEALAYYNSLIDAMHEALPSDIAVRERATAREALSAMIARGFRITPVVDREGRLKGSIRLEDLQTLAIFEPDEIPKTPTETASS